MNVYTQKLLHLLSLEYNCDETDFLQSRNILTESAVLEGRRRYSSKKYYFHMCTLGGNAVITADPELHPFLNEFIQNRQGHWLFEFRNLLPLEKELNAHGQGLTGTYHMFLPTSDTVSPRHDYPVKWFFDGEIAPFYEDGRFTNALSPSYNPLRPDRIAVCAYDGDQLMGMAGCSEDTNGWMQVGIDVLPAYRSHGIGTYLVTLLKNEIISRGLIPFYGTSLSNYHSWNIALNCGFRPAWVEIGSQPL